MKNGYLAVAAVLCGLVLLGLLVQKYSFFASDNRENKAAGKLQVILPEKKETPTPEPNVKLFLIGDVMLGRSVNITSLEANDPTYPFKKVGSRLRESGIVFANLEGPIVENCPKIEHGFTFCADPKMVDGLLYSGIDIVSLANNHILNFGRKGLEDTKMILTGKGIKWVGQGNLEIIEKEGISFGFLGFDKSQQVLPQLTKEELELVRNSDKKVAVLVVAMHWGVEYQNKALPGVRKLAEELVQNGADVISGAHPHWVQDFELMGGKPVYYSLGNFVFDQMWSEETKKGMAVELSFKGSNVVSEEILHTYIKNVAQPEWVE